MKFPADVGDFSEEEISAISAWIGRLETNGFGRRILYNMREEPNVPVDLWARFLRNLCVCLGNGHNEFQVINVAIVDDMLLMGPRVHADSLSEWLARLVTARSLGRLLPPSVPLFSDDYDVIYDWVENDVIPLKRIVGKVLMRGRRPIVWATLAEEVDRCLALSYTTDQICNKLGLSIEKGELLIELRYNKDKIGTICRPTVLEAGDNFIFYPSQVDEDLGYTWDISTRDATGFPEIVHEPILWQEVDDFIPRGKKKSSASVLLREIFEDGL